MLTVSVVACCPSCVHGHVPIGDAWTSGPRTRILMIDSRGTIHNEQDHMAIVRPKLQCYGELSRVLLHITVHNENQQLRHMKATDRLTITVINVFSSTFGASKPLLKLFLMLLNSGQSDG